MTMLSEDNATTLPENGIKGKLVQDPPSLLKHWVYFYNTGQEGEDEESLAGNFSSLEIASKIGHEGPCARVDDCYVPIHRPSLFRPENVIVGFGLYDAFLLTAIPAPGRTGKTAASSFAGLTIFKTEKDAYGKRIREENGVKLVTNPLASILSSSIQLFIHLVLNEDQVTQVHNSAKSLVGDTFPSSSVTIASILHTAGFRVGDGDISQINLPALFGFLIAEEITHGGARILTDLLSSSGARPEQYWEDVNRIHYLAESKRSERRLMKSRKEISLLICEVRRMKQAARVKILEKWVKPVIS